MDGGDTVQTWVRRPVTEGEWAGWTVWGDDAFEMLAGPFFCRQREDGGMVCAFRAEAKHMNGGGFMHGGCLLTFADYALFCIGGDALQGTGSVTASLHGDFIDSASVGDMIEGSGEVVRAGGSLVFIRGAITTGGRTLMSFSGIVKKVRTRAPAT